jgi:hypothetical protein
VSSLIHHDVLAGFAVRVLKQIHASSNDEFDDPAQCGQRPDDPDARGYTRSIRSRLGRIALPSPHQFIQMLNLHRPSGPTSVCNVEPS